MSTQGVGTFAINSFWESGRLIFYEKAYGHTTTGNVFILGADYVQVGDTANDVDFNWKGDTTGTFTLDAGAHTLALTGMATSTDGAVTITNATATSSTTTGALIVTGGIATAADITVGDDIFLGSGAVINFNAGNVTITHAAGRLAVAVAAPTAGINAFSVALTGGDAAPGTCRAIVGSATTFTTMTADNIVGVRGDVTMAGATSGTSYLYGAQGKAITGANTFTGTALAGLYGQIDITGGTITSGHVAAIQANIYGANSGTIPMEGIYIESAGGGVINSFIQCFGKSTYVFDFASNTHTQMGTAGTVTTNAGYLTVLVEGSVRYIGLGSAVA
uniref:Uncharacterized protein n=1 Tax=viral metagenome TaxID=1070528 RepID=A0A6M3K493_9ZZZZ